MYRRYTHKCIYIHTCTYVCADKIWYIYQHKCIYTFMYIIYIHKWPYNLLIFKNQQNRYIHIYQIYIDIRIKYLAIFICLNKSSCNFWDSVWASRTFSFSFLMFFSAEFNNSCRSLFFCWTSSISASKSYHVYRYIYLYVNINACKYIFINMYLYIYIYIHICTFKRVVWLGRDKDQGLSICTNHNIYIHTLNLNRRLAIAIGDKGKDKYWNMYTCIFE